MKKNTISNQDEEKVVMLRIATCDDEELLKDIVARLKISDITALENVTKFYR